MDEETPPPSLSVEVTVSDEDGYTGEVTPIEGVEITLYRWDEAEGWLSVDRELPSTDAEGTASFEVTEVGQFTLGYVDPSNEHAPSYGTGRRTLDEVEPEGHGTFAHDGTGGGGVGFDARMPRVFEPDPEVEDAEVVGLVLDEQGDPIPNVKVEAIVVESQDPEQGAASRAVPGELEEGDQVAYTDWTNDNSQYGNHEPRGGYRLILPPGDYRILFTREDEDTSYFYGEEAPEVVTVEAGRHYDLSDTVLPSVPETPTAVLTGTMVDAAGNGMAYRYVNFYRLRENQNHLYLGSGYTDADGVVAFSRAPVGKPIVACANTRTYQLVCGQGRRGLWEAADDAVTIPADVEEYQATEPLVLDPSVDVTVRLVGLRDQAIDPDDHYLFLRRRDGSQPNNWWSTDGSSVTFGGIFPGEYTVCGYFTGGQECLGSSDGLVGPVEDAEYFEVPSGSLTFEGPQVRLPYAGTFEGSVVDMSDDPKEDIEVSVLVVRNEGDWTYYDTFDYTRTAADGSFSLAFGPPGDYYVCLRLRALSNLHCTGADDENYFGTAHQVGADDETIPLGEVRVPVPVIMTGKVTYADGAPVDYPYVQLYGRPEPGADYSRYLGGFSGRSDGTYEVEVFPGEEEVTLCANRNGYENCLGGTQRAYEDGTVFFSVDGEQDPLVVQDLVLSTTNNADECEPSSTYSWDNGGSVLDNGTLAMGFACFGNVVTYQPGFDELGYDHVGLRLNDGDPETVDQDAIVRGCECEGWGVGDAMTGVSGFASFWSGHANVRLAGYTESEADLTATSTVNVGWWQQEAGIFDVTHEALPSNDPNAHLVRVTIQNVSDQDTLLRYRRTIDWDVAPTAFNEIVTSVTGNLPEMAFMSNDGFASPDPLSRRDSRGATGNFVYGPKDQGSLLDLDFGELGPGERRVFTLALGGAASQAEAQEVLDGLSAQAYSMATASDPEEDTSYFIAYGVTDDGATQLPTATADAVTVSSGMSAEIDVLANDEANTEDGGLVIQGASGAQHGVVMCTEAVCTYQHDGSGAGSDSFRYTIRNSAGLTATGRVNITVSKPAPVAVVATTPVIEPAHDVVEGDEVTVTPATYSDVKAATTRSFEWFLDYGGSSTYRFASGAGTTVTVPAWAAGARVFVKETVTAAGYTAVSSTSERTAAVQDAPEVYATAWPELDGTPKEGVALAPVGAEWNVEPDAISYRWYVGGSLVPAGDERLSDGGRVFTPGAADVGNWLEVELFATKADHSPGYSWAWGSRIRGKDEKTRVLQVTVTDPAQTVVSNASVSVCTNQECLDVRKVGESFESEVPTSANGIDYQVVVYPYSSSFLRTTKKVTVEHGDEPKAVAVTLEKIKKAPPAVTFPPVNGNQPPTSGTGDDKIPMGFIGSPLAPFTATGCTPVENPTWTVIFANGTESMTGTVTAEDTEVEAGTDPETVTYTVRIPALTSSGHATIETNFDCDGPISFTIYIDPSGYVTDQFGRTIAGAEVTLLRDMGAGQFGPVADGDAAVMDPAVNDSNPSLTDATGFFRWDVAAGDYRVSVTDATSGGAACAVVTTPTMSVPPERVDLVVKTECAGATTPTPTTVPAVTGERRVGQELQVSDGAWAHGIRQVGVQWLRDGTPITGATGSSYTLVADDAGHAVTARVTAQRPDYAQENGSGAVVGFTAFTSPASGGGAVTPSNPGGGGGGGGGGGNPTPTPTIANTVKPAITGDAVVGGSLAASEGTWSTDGLTFAYQWLRDGEPIEGATATQYAPVVADLGKAVSVKVTATKSGSTPGTATSDPVTVEKGAAPQNSAKPAITGTPELGETLTVSDGEWDLEDLSFGYQWLRDGEAIEGATEATYVVTEDDLGTELAAEVAASKDGHEDGSATSDAIAVPDEPDVVEPVESVTKARLLGKKVKQGDRGEVKVKVTSEAESAPTGTVTVTAGKKSVEVELSEADNGTLKIRLPKLKPGKHEVSVEYSGDDAALASSDDAGTLRVTKKSKGKKNKGKDKGSRFGGGRPMPTLL
ncbi:MAG: Ig-like domain repeat protein [Actinobacteria bacterium]|nr:Ig-like domain repeat protein [Actinomycetota bacterium]MBU2111389.1 Ig-like domain repeat protein [Actinomycetota bacterium]